jgi:16S rRNA (guanine527-N7)-methyltransferase
VDDLSQQVLSLLGIQLSQSQREAFRIFERELLLWNSQINLTAIHDPEQIQVKHFLDSLTCLLVMGESPPEKVVDIGTGAGFPGIPLKILIPSMQLTLVESVAKKTKFCQHLVDQLGLDLVTIVQKRAELLGQDIRHREHYRWAIARSVAVLPVLAEYLLPLVHVGGTMISMKGEGAPAEAHDAEHAIGVLGGHFRRLIPLTLPGVSEERYLVVIDKIAPTPDNFPRRVGIPRKRPLK